MKVDKTIENGKAVFRLEGRLDSTTSPELEKEIMDVIGDLNELVLDLKDLEYTSSAGMRVLLSAQRIMNSQGSMKVINVRSEIMDIFEITGFNQILTIE
ncbi:MAG: STAS domain-containing protein [Oscillospiraceae bacterium]|nr:STAS domain-containing protein [Oscillospiraceae bacterium]